jgi:hypothetical protein
MVFDGLVNTKQIQFLSHQSKIATKIELFVDTLDDTGKDVQQLDGLVNT